MQYMVRGADGNEYGPVDGDGLRVWVQENRIRPDSQLRDTATGQTMTASTIPGLFHAAAPTAPPPNWSQPPSPATYPRQQPQYRGHDGSMTLLWHSVARSVLAVVFFFFLHTLGLILAAYAVYYA